MLAEEMLSICLNFEALCLHFAMRFVPLMTVKSMGVSRSVKEHHTLVFPKSALQVRSALFLKVSSPQVLNFDDSVLVEMLPVLRIKLNPEVPVVFPVDLHS